MGYIFGQSSNSVVPGKELNLEIMILNESQQKIKPVGFFGIDKVYNIVDNWRGLKCELYGKKEDGKIPSKQERIISFRIPDDRQIISANLKALASNEYKYLILKIYKAKCSWPLENPESVAFEISFSDDNNTDAPDQLMKFPVFKETNLKIELFEATPVVIQGGVDKMTAFSLRIRGENYSYSIVDDFSETGLPATVKPSATASGLAEEKQIYCPVTIGDHMYTLVVKDLTPKSDIVLKASVAVRGLNRSDFFPVNNPPGGSTLANICVANDGNEIFSLIVNNNTIEGIGRSADGFSGNWEIIGLSDKDKQILKAFAYSPIIHLKDAGEMRGRLLFIGGSKVQAKGCNNFMVKVDLEKDKGPDKKEVDRVSAPFACPWPSRMGHCCVTFPYGAEDVNKIWLIGGQDEYGAALNDAWVSENGTDWLNTNADGTVNPWAPRCYFSASVQLDNQGKPAAIWIGGGLAEEGGKETPDIWKWDLSKRKWSKITTDGKDSELRINGSSYLSSAVAFVGKDDTPESTGMYIFGGFKAGSSNGCYFLQLTRDGTIYTTNEIKCDLLALQTIRNSNIITLFFRGCLWFLVLTNKGDEGIGVSMPLYYWVPSVNSHTINFS